MNPEDIDLALIDSKERQVLGMAATAAFLKMCADDATFLPDMLAVCPGMSKSRISEDWRHGQVKRITQGRARRVSEVVRRDFDEVLGAFCAMAGQDARAFEAYLRGAKGAKAAETGGPDSPAARGWLAKCYKEGPGYGFNAQWMAGYARPKALSELTAKEAKSLYVTMRSRYFARRKKSNLCPE